MLPEVCAGKPYHEDEDRGGMEELKTWAECKVWEKD